MPIHIYAEEMMKTEALCTEEHAPRCRARCPLHVDMREICGRVAAGADDRARETFTAAAVLPRVTAKLCDAPCMDACRRADVDCAVQIGALERYLTAGSDWTQRALSVRFRSKHRAAVVGAGASGLTAAMYLASKGFLVTVFERGAAVGTRLVGQNGVTQEDVERDLAPAASYIEWRCGVEVGTDVSLSTLCEEFEAVLCTGTLPEESVQAVDPATLQIPQTNRFVSGRRLLHMRSFAASLCSGKRAAITMERFLKGISLTAMRVHEDAYETGLFTAIDGIEQVPAVPETGVYTAQQARTEAARCLDCHCMQCVRACVFLQKFDRFPRRYIREIANTISLLRDGIRSGKNLMVACSLCGLCGKICPNGVSMDKIALAGRAAMVQKGELSDAVYDFPVRDMLFSNGEQAALCRHAPGRDRSQRVFFPGCQLAASAPDTVRRTYAHLLSLEPETGIVLGCCGAPADWSGRERLYEETVSALKEKLSALGDPEVVCACPTCLKQLRAAGVCAVSLYPILAAGPMPGGVRHPRAVAVHDSCAARDEFETHSAVRALLSQCGYALEELPFSGERTKCCGYGGLVFYGDSDVAQKMIEARTAESPLPYVAYCSVCRDYLVRAGKPCVHVLDVFFGTDDDARWESPGANISEKEENRLALSDAILAACYGENRPAARVREMPLIVSPAVEAILEQRWITKRSVRAVIAQAQTSGTWLVRPGDGHRIASFRPGIITYWVEYAPQDAGFIVYNAYSHRVEISEART